MKIFIQNFSRYKLAEHFRTDPVNINFVSYFNPHAGYDLEFNRKKYQVKFSNPVKGNMWDFDVRDNTWEEGENVKSARENSTCDFYVLIGMIDDIPESIFLMPVKETPSSHVRISVDGNSKYKEFEI